jgi:hypothetical protein
MGEVINTIAAELIQVLRRTNRPRQFIGLPEKGLLISHLPNEKLGRC